MDNIKFSPKQLSVVFWLCKGRSYKEIGKILGLSPRTIEHYVERIKNKINAYTLTDVRRFFEENITFMGEVIKLESKELSREKRRVYQQEYYYKNKEARLAYQMKWYSLNKETQKQDMRDYYHANKEKCNQKARERYYANKEKHLERMRLYRLKKSQEKILS